MSSHSDTLPPLSPLSSLPPSPPLSTVPTLPILAHTTYQSETQNSSQLPATSVDGRDLGNDDDPSFIGPVGLEDFFSGCFPTVHKPFAGKQPPRRFAAQLKRVFSAKLISSNTEETLMCDALVRATTKACSLMIDKGESSSMSIRNCSGRTAKQDGKETAMDIAIFPEDAPENTPWFSADVFIKVRQDAKDDPFVSLQDRDIRYETTVQFYDYALHMTKAKPRCFVFGIGIFGHFCRFFCWDRSASVVSERFNYITDPEILADFLVRLDRVGQEGRGVDVTASLPVTAAAEVKLVQDACKEAVRRGLVDHLPDVTAATRILVPTTTGSEEEEVFLSVGSPIFNSQDLFGPGTRTWLAIRAGSDDLQFVVLKDAWREEGWRSEGAIYDEIYGREEGCPGTGTFAFGVARMDRDVELGNDVDDSRRQTRVPDLHKGKYIKRTHHRAILLSVGIPLHRFSSTRQLIEAIRDAIIGHKNMVEAGVIHRDISTNNILISADPKDEQGAKGFIIDPEFSFSKTDRPEEGCGLTGTFQFISINRLMNPDAEHKVWHDLESYYWVTLYSILRHTPTNQSPDILSTVFDEGYERKLAFVVECCLAESPSVVEVKGHIPLTKLLRDLVMLVRSHYASQGFIASVSDSNISPLDRLTHTNVLKAFETALNSQGWPSHDAVVTLSFESFPPQSKQVVGTVRQDLQQRNDQPRISQKMLVAGDGGNCPSTPQTRRRSKRKVVEVEGENIPPSASERTGNSKTSGNALKRRKLI
ncbi:hypothetical protein JAAARDRAFT_211210 [Jaapia argillacea MUCL 33604]|uniref:Fungal-type protein kinase domain-containing protein n=1 Tax=Jaapia argillacea MUCL 33604 TaxID=933084 RepID=A0A067PBM7_9AGAM|nr:hypothetical protein JAAARDRAFT_211210 [Jaapia argillacea MUCL 33604]